MACSFSLQFPGEDLGAVDAGCLALEVVEELEQRLTIYRGDSEVSQLNREAYLGPVPVSPDLLELLVRAGRIAWETDGAFDYTCGTLIRAWGFFRGPKRVPGRVEHSRALASSGFRNLVLEGGTVRFLREGLELNLGGIGKGFAIDRALAQLRTPCVLMQAGGSSTRARGAPAGESRGWQIQIGDRTRVWLKDRALATSGLDQQYFVHDGRRYGHILDPRTGWPANTVRCASAIANSAAEADALSTAFFVLGVDRTREYCRKHPEAGAVLETHDAKVMVMGDFDVEVNS
jgi:thiamine biosynthesis lipoprotein